MKVINNNIEEVRVGIDNAKLLKEAGFGVLCGKCWGRKNQSGEDSELKILPEYIVHNWNGLNKSVWSAPTQQLAIDWIRVNFGIEITLTCVPDKLWGFLLLNLNETEKFGNTGGVILYKKERNTSAFDTPEEAKEAAIKYVLENLINKK